MKPLSRLLLTLLLITTTTACSPDRNPTPFPSSLTDQLFASDAFSEPLEELDADLTWMLYGLEEAGLPRASLTGAQSYRSSGATCEELALLTFTDEDSAQTAANTLDVYLTGQIQANRTYRPKEIPKLEQAFLERRGTTVLLMVASNYQATHNVLAP